MNTTRKRTRRHNRWQIAALVLVFAVSAIACNTSAPEPTPTDVPAPTDTAVPPPTETDTPEPTATDTPEPTPTDTPEPTPTPTETFTPTPDLAATAEVEATAAAEAALAVVQETLEDIGRSTEGGSLAWAQDETVDLEIRTFGTYDWFPVDEGEDFKDFVFHSDITWESTGGLAICGLVIRSESSNLSIAKHYRFQTIRLSGLPSWDVELWEFNDFVTNVAGTIRAAPAIDQSNGATNSFTMVAEGSTLTIYLDDSRLGTVVISSIEEGQLGFFAWQESGETTCSFSNSWVWELDD